MTDNNIGQIKELNRRQQSGEVHPYTCGNDSSHILVAKADGWHCPKCDYRQPFRGEINIGQKEEGMEHKPDFEAIIQQVFVNKHGMTSNLRKLSAIADRSLEKEMCQLVYDTYVIPLQSEVKIKEARIRELEEEMAGLIEIHHVQDEDLKKEWQAMMDRIKALQQMNKSRVLRIAELENLEAEKDSFAIGFFNFVMKQEWENIYAEKTLPELMEEYNKITFK